MIAVIAALSLAQAEPPQAPPEAGHVVVAPDWAALPKAKDMIDYAPAALKEKGLGGEAILRCRVSAKGRLTDCVVQSEKPVGLGFGEAALQVSHRFRFKPKTVDGRPVESDPISVPVAWRTPAR